jgi:putative ABC transport system permease protein
MFRTALRTVLAHKARLLMTVLAVMLGVAFVSGTLVFTDTLGNAFRGQSAKSYKDVAVAVSSHDARDRSDGSGGSDRPGGSDAEGRELDAGIGEQTMAKLRAVDGAAAVTGRVNGFAGVADPDGKLIGASWANSGGNFAPGADDRDAAYTFADGAGPSEAGQIALDKASAAAGEYKVGDSVRVATNGPVKAYTLSGIFTTEDGAVNAGGSLVLFETKVAQRLYLEPGFFQDVTITAASGASDRKILDEVKKVIPENADAQTGSELAADQADEIESGLSSLNQILLAFAAIALFVGVFLISNTFTMLVAQRTRELALMRAVGASRRQVKRTVLAEAAVVGVVASAIGFVLGIGLATGLRSAMSAFGDAKVPAGGLVISPTAVGAAFGVGVLITLLAAWLPARRAAKIPPVAAMSSVHAVATTRSLVVRNSIGGGIALLGGGAILWGASSGSDGRLMIGVGAFLAMVGIIVLIPLLSRPVIALIRPLLNRLFGVSGKLAGQNAVRNPRRTGATASALAIGLTLVTGLSVLGVTIGQAVDRMTTDNIRADYMLMMASGGPLDASALTAVEKVTGVTAVSPQQATTLKIDGDDRSASAVTAEDIGKVFRFTTVSGSMASLSGNAIAVADRTAESNGWTAGDTVAVTYPDGKKADLKIGAVYKGNEFLSPLLISTDLADPHESESLISELWVKMDGGPSEANEQALVNALGKNPAINVMDQQDIRNTYSGFFNTALNILYGLLAMALIIAVLGVVNTLAMSVFERQQEIGMLRAIGLDRRRVKRMIRLEAVVISLFGAVVGVGLGTFLAWAIGQTIKSAIEGYALVVPWDRIGLFLVLAALVGVLAALWPARSAAKLDMLTAIKTE